MFLIIAFYTNFGTEGYFNVIFKRLNGTAVHERDNINVFLVNLQQKVQNTIIKDGTSFLKLLFGEKNWAFLIRMEFSMRVI